MERKQSLKKKYLSKNKYQVNLLLTAHYNNSNIMINTVETGGLMQDSSLIGICQEDVGKNPS